MSGVRVPLRPRSQKDHARVCKWLKRLASHASTVRFRGFDSHPVYVTADAVALIESPTAGAVLPEKLMLRGAKLHFGQKSRGEVVLEIRHSPRAFASLVQW